MSVYRTFYSFSFLGFDTHFKIRAGTSLKHFLAPSTTIATVGAIFARPRNDFCLSTLCAAIVRGFGRFSIVRGTAFRAGRAVRRRSASIAIEAANRANAGRDPPLIARP